MKRSEIKRKTPLKSSVPIKKARKKSKLQKDKDKMDSPYWGNKCRRAVAAFMHTQACFICGRREPEVDLVCGHHNIFKSMSKFHRWHPMNIVPLCKEHHLYNQSISPHQKHLPLAIEAYAARLKLRLPEHYLWWTENEKERKQQRLTVGFIPHPDWRYQFTIWQQRANDARILQENDNG